MTNIIAANDTQPKTSDTMNPATSILPLKVIDLCFIANGQKLLQGVSFKLNAGPKIIIVGPNGAGKSLLLRLCHGLLMPSSGTVEWAGELSSTKHLKQAMVFQRPVLLRRTVAQNIDYGLKLRKLPRVKRAQITDDVLNRTGLARFADKPARLLSGGEQQKLALARAWALKPEVLFLDEPTASLDPAATHGVETIIQSMHDEGTQIVMTTHDLGQAKRIADDMMFIHKGRLLESTPAEQFFDAPQSGEAAAFLRGELRW